MPCSFPAVHFKVHVYRMSDGKSEAKGWSMWSRGVRFFLWFLYHISRRFQTPPPSKVRTAHPWKHIGGGGQGCFKFEGWFSFGQERLFWSSPKGMWGMPGLTISSGWDRKRMPDLVSCCEANHFLALETAVCPNMILRLCDIKLAWSLSRLARFWNYNPSLSLPVIFLSSPFSGFIYCILLQVFPMVNRMMNMLVICIRQYITYTCRCWLFWLYLVCSSLF